jgi:uncharacterized protein
MDLTLDSSNSKYIIRAYEAGKILINEKTFTQSIIVTPNQLIHPWQPQKITELSENHLQAILNLKPQTVLLGTGASWQIIKPDLLVPFYQARIGIEIMDTAAACRTFNVLASEDRNVAAALLIT